MEGSAFLPLPQGLRITAIVQEEMGLTVEVFSERISACCPLCEQWSDAVHSRYQRRLKDVPCAGQAVRLHLTVQKFFCVNSACKRKIFTERMPTFVEPWVQMTLRLSQALQAIGLSTSGSLGARLAGRLGIATSWMTILRRVMEIATPNVSSVTVLGIDDFSFRRGRTFGTILVDINSHQVIDLLPERSAESAASWMRGHPEIQYVSRDRGKDYAQAASEAAPQAIQIVDRFHLMKNFVEALDQEVSRCYRSLHQVQAPLPPSDLPTLDEWRQVPDANQIRKGRAKQASKRERFEQAKNLLSQGFSAQEMSKQLSLSLRTVYRWKKQEVCPAHQLEREKRPERQARWEQAKALQLRGLSQKEIADRLAVGVRTVQRWQTQEDYQAYQSRRRRRSIFDPYAAYVLSRWQQGERSVERIFQEIREQGFSGSIQTLYRYVRALRQDSASLPAPTVLDHVSAQKALWLIVRPEETLKADERKDLQECCQASQELVALHTLAQSFGQIIRKREQQQLATWMKQVQESSFRHIKRFASGLQRDHEEVFAALTSIHSNGQVEGFVNKLKLMKRQGYGRASFPLLRQRMLHAL